MERPVPRATFWCGRSIRPSLLRRLAAGERVNDQVDWQNVIEEVESVGSAQLHGVESLLVQPIAYRVKA